MCCRYYFFNYLAIYPFLHKISRLSLEQRLTILWALSHSRSMQRCEYVVFQSFDSCDINPLANTKALRVLHISIIQRG